MSTRKKIIIIGTGLIILIGIWLGITLFFQQKQQSDPTVSIPSFFTFPIRTQNQPEQNLEEIDIEEFLNFEDTETRLSVLTQLSPFMISGYTLEQDTIKKTTTDNEGNEIEFDELQVRVVFNDFNQGFMYERTIFPSISALIQITDTFFPGIQRLDWNQNTLIARYLNNTFDGIETFTGSILRPLQNNEEGTQSLGRLVGNYMRQNLIEVSKSPNSNKWFLLYKTDNGSEGVIFDPATDQETIIMRSPISEWNVFWEKEESIYFITKSSNTISGYSYRFDIKTQEWFKLTQGPGLTMLPSMHNKHIITTFQNNQIVTSLFNETTQSTTRLPFTTVPEKCTWLNQNELICAVPRNLGNTLPDEWYQGKIVFQDTLVHFDTASMSIIKEIDLTQYSNQIFDIIEMNYFAAGNLLFFKNNSNGFLWMLNLENSMQE